MGDDRDGEAAFDEARGRFHTDETRPDDGGTSRALSRSDDCVSVVKPAKREDVRQVDAVDGWPARHGASCHERRRIVEVAAVVEDERPGNDVERDHFSIPQDLDRVFVVEGLVLSGIHSGWACPLR